MPGPRLQVLTPLTRGVSENRRRVFGGLEVQYATMLVLLVGFLPGLALTLLLFPWLGSLSLLALVVVEVAVYWLFRARSRRGLGLRNYETLRDRRRSDLDRWFICGLPFDPEDAEVGDVLRGHVPSTTTTDSDAALDDLLDEVLGRP